MNCWSIVIPTYNRAKYLPDALSSVFAQGVAGTQVTVVDDGSTDGTREVVSRFGGRVQYVYQENRGPAAARNCGLCLARGKFISFLDSDDVWLPGKMRLERELFASHPEADVVATDHDSWIEGRLFHESGFRSIGLELGPPRRAATAPPGLTRLGRRQTLRHLLLDTQEVGASAAGVGALRRFFAVVRGLGLRGQDATPLPRPRRPARDGERQKIRRRYPR